MKNFKIVLSQDRHSAALYLPRIDKTLRFYDSYGDVMVLIEDFLLKGVNND